MIKCRRWLLVLFLLLRPRLVVSSPSWTQAPKGGASIVSREVTNTSKAGLAWPNGNSVDIDQYAVTGKVSWYYTWSMFSVQSNDLEYVPMLWGQRDADQFADSIEDILKRNPNITAVLGMNEPEQPGQSNMTAEEGVALWQSHLEPLSTTHGLRLGSPAISSAPSGKTWLQDFFSACENNCNVSFIAAHWYGTNATWFISYVEDLAETFDLPIWITEWACHNFVDLHEQCSREDIFAFMNETQSYMDNSTAVERYAWFGAMKELQGVNPDDAIMDSRGRINALGAQYIGMDGNQTFSLLGGVDPSTTSQVLFPAGLAVLGLALLLV